MDFSVITVLLRLVMGFLLFFAGIGKLTGPGLKGFAGYIVSDFTEKTWLPKFMLVPYGYVLPFAELILGFLLIIGLFTRPTIIVSALMLISLMFGKILTGDHATVANIAQYVVFLCLVYWTSRDNMFSVDYLRGKG
jgi:thiosulfate dehydrogenase [quinone] large subunit